MINSATATDGTQSAVGWGVGIAILAMLVVFLVVFGASAVSDHVFAKDVVGMYLNDRLHPERRDPIVYSRDAPLPPPKLGRKVVFATLLRDGESCVSVMRARFATLFDMFQKCALVVYENDSADGTRDALAQWSREDRRVKVIGTTEGAVAAEVAGNHASRIARMAHMRQMCLDHIRAKHSDASYVVVFDADIDGAWNLSGLMDSFQRMERGEADAIAASGRCTLPGIAGALLPDNEYDTGAFKPKSKNEMKTKTKTRDVPWDDPKWPAVRMYRRFTMTAGVASARLRGKLFAVDAAFSGLCIYRANDFCQGSYIDRESSCEHTALLRTMQRNRKVPLRVAINPRMEVFIGGNELNRLGKRCKFYQNEKNHHDAGQ